MASIANSSSIHPSGIEAEAADTQPQAGPLPIKRGEIGYVGAVDGARSSSPEAVLPARHPADRDHSAPPTVAVPSETPGSSASDAALTHPSASTCALSNNSIKHKVLCFFKPKNDILFYGIRLSSLLILFLLLTVLGGTLAGWIILTKAMNNNTSNASTTTILSIHILFGACVLSELFLLERRVYRIRAERYGFLHPGETLPTARNGRPADIPFSPWNRPSLPTYAAALVQSGTGTGDVEDHLIAQPPPPAYGNTRGSTLLLSGYLRNSLLAQRPSSRQGRPQQIQMSQRNDDRPKSYHSRDEEWEEIQDAARARRLEETLARIERPVSH